MINFLIFSRSITNSPPQFFVNNEEPQENLRNNFNNQPENDGT